VQVHARNKFFRSEKERDALLQEIAELTEDFTGAELQNILCVMPNGWFYVLNMHSSTSD